MRWNSDFDCLYSHLYFKTVIQSMTGVTENKLKAYRLNEDQWDLAEDLQAVLVVVLFYFLLLISILIFSSAFQRSYRTLFNS